MKNLEKFKKGILTAEETESYTKQLVQVKFDQERKDRWQQQLKDKYQISRFEQKKTGNIRRLFTVIGAAAAIGLLLVFAQPLLQKFTPKQYLQLTEQYLKEEPFPNPLVRKGEQETAMLRLRAAESYSLGNYQKSIELNELLIKSKEAVVDDYFYLGLSHLYLNEYELALPNLQKASQLSIESRNRFQQEIQWFLSLALIKSEQIESAKATLKAIKSDEWNFAKAQTLIQQLP